MEKIKQYKYIILITLMVLVFGFYWFEWRPAHIRRECSKTKNLFDSYLKETAQFDNNYKNCLRENGLEN